MGATFKLSLQKEVSLLQITKVRELLRNLLEVKAAVCFQSSVELFGLAISEREHEHASELGWGEK